MTLRSEKRAVPSAGQTAIARTFGSIVPSYRRAVDVLRTATEPLTAREIARAGVGGCEHQQARQGRAGGPDRDRLGVPAESSG